MTITKLKAKNQLTIPQEIVTRMRLKKNELFAVEVKENYIMLMPVEVEPRYTADEVDAIDTLVEREKSSARAMKPGKEFSAYIKKIA